MNSLLFHDKSSRLLILNHRRAPYELNYLTRIPGLFLEIVSLC